MKLNVLKANETEIITDVLSCINSLKGFILFYLFSTRFNFHFLQCECKSYYYFFLLSKVSQYFMVKCCTTCAVGCSAIIIAIIHQKDRMAVVKYSNYEVTISGLNDR